MHAEGCKTEEEESVPREPYFVGDDETGLWLECWASRNQLLDWKPPVDSVHLCREDHKLYYVLSQWFLPQLCIRIISRAQNVQAMPLPESLSVGPMHHI